MNPQSTFDVVGKSFKGLLLAAVLYPLERIQSIQQIQSTYSNVGIKTSSSIVGEAIHYGSKSYFRGFMSFLTKSAFMTSAVKLPELIEWKKDVSYQQRQLLSLGFGLFAYCLFYPYQIINLHMSVEVQRQRFYSNIRQCISKIKKNQGIKTFYRGFIYSSALFAFQLGSIRYAKKTIEEQGKSFSQLQKMGLLLGLIGTSEILFYPFNTIKYVLRQIENFFRLMVPSDIQTAISE